MGRAILPGIQMRKARTDQDLSVDEVATSLGLSERALKALESDDYEKLPSAVYVRGYIRRYCALLNIDEGAIIEAFEALVDSDAKRRSPDQRTSALEVGGWRLRTTALLVGAGVLLLLIAIAIFAIA